MISTIIIYILINFLWRAIRDDIEGEDDQVRVISFFPYSSFSIYPFPNIISSFFSVQESYFNAISSAPIIIYEEDELDYDSDGNPVIPEGARVSLCTGQYDYHLGRSIQWPFRMIVCPEGLLIIFILLFH